MTTSQNLQPSHDVETFASAQQRLRDAGFTHDFEMDHTHVSDVSTSRRYDPATVEIVSMHPDECGSNPDDNSLLFALRAPDGVHGLLVAHDAETDMAHADALRRLGAGCRATAERRTSADVGD